MSGPLPTPARARQRLTVLASCGPVAIGLVAPIALGEERPRLSGGIPQVQSVEMDLDRYDLAPTVFEMSATVMSRVADEVLRSGAGR